MQAIEQCRERIKLGHKAVLMQGCTGSGKGAQIGFMAAKAYENKNRTWITAHRIEIVNQLSKTLQRLNVPHGLITASSKPNDSELIQVCSIDTLRNRLGWIKEPRFIIADEVHHCIAAGHRQVYDAYPLATLAGFTATPARTNGQGLGRSSGGLFDSMVIGKPMQELIDEGFLARPIHYSTPPSDHIDLSKVHTKLGDYNKQELSAVMESSRITGGAVDHYLRLVSPKPCLTFAVTLKHAHAVQAEYAARGVRAVVIEGKMSHDERSDILAGFGDGHYDVMISVSLIDEGVDICGVMAVQDLSPTQSLIRYMQRGGRGCRIMPGKTDFIYLDHVANYMRHGLLPDHREWSLDSKKRNNKSDPKIPVQTCPKCFAAFSPATICPQCGEVMPVKKKEPPKQEVGELVEVLADVKKVHAGHQRFRDLMEKGKKLGYNGYIYAKQNIHRRAI